MPADTIFVFVFLCYLCLLRAPAVIWAGIPKTLRPDSSLRKTLVFCLWSGKYFLGHNSSLTPVFLSTNLRV